MTTVYDYDEVTYGLSSSPSSSNWSNIDPLYKWDTHFPERYSRLELNPDYPLNMTVRKKRVRCRNAARFKTQPITFDEIKEVDDEEPDPNREGIKNQFQAFSRSMDGLMPAKKDFDPTLRKSVPGPIIIDATTTNLQQTTPSNSDDSLVQPQSLDGSCESPREKKETDWASASLGMSHEMARARRRRSKKSQHRKTIHDIPEGKQDG